MQAPQTPEDYHGLVHSLELEIEQDNETSPRIVSFSRYIQYSLSTERTSSDTQSKGAQHAVLAGSCKQLNKLYRMYALLSGVEISNRLAGSIDSSCTVLYEAELPVSCRASRFGLLTGG